MSDSIRIERLVGEEIASRLHELARLRITVFREFPYLYEGSMEYEEKYLQTYINAPESVLVLALGGERVVGSSSGIPLSDEVPEFRLPFEQHGYDVDKIFYFAESVLLPAYRGRGIGAQLFDTREAYARSLGRFEFATFCVVERPADHPRRPPDYVPLDAFWKRRGYEKHPELRTTFSWQDLDEEAESPKPMVFWLKRLKD